MKHYKLTTKSCSTTPDLMEKLNRTLVYTVNLARVVPICTYLEMNKDIKLQRHLFSLEWVFTPSTLQKIFSCPLWIHNLFHLIIVGYIVRLKICKVACLKVLGQLACVVSLKTRMKVWRFILQFFPLLFSPCSHILHLQCGQSSSSKRFLASLSLWRSRSQYS